MNGKQHSASRTSSYYLSLVRRPVSRVSRHYVRMQPLDTWVSEVAMRLEIIQTKENTPANRRAVVKACLDVEVDPNRFNAGAYWAGKEGMLSQLGI